jgi:hypothetical protein
MTDRTRYGRVVVDLPEASGVDQAQRPNLEPGSLPAWRLFKSTVVKLVEAMRVRPSTPRVGCTSTR